MTEIQKSRTYPNTIDNIPSGILSCRVELPQEAKTEDQPSLSPLEVTVTELSEAHLCVRIFREDRENEPAKGAFGGKTILVSFRCFFWGRGYKDFGPFEAKVVDVKDGAAYSVLCAEVSERSVTEYAAMIRNVEVQLFSYIKEKIDSEDNTFSKDLVGYPSELDEGFSLSLSEWQEKIECETNLEERRREVAAMCEKQGIDLAASLENPQIWNRYLDDTLPSGFSHIYIGNAYCHNLFPDRNVLERILMKVLSEGTRITIVLTYLRESIIEKQEKMIDFVLAWAAEHGEQIEFEINDLGWLQYFREREEADGKNGKAGTEKPIRYTLRFGRLLNKRRKDPRFVYKDRWEEQAEHLAENALGDVTFVRFLREYGVTGCETESCGYRTAPPADDLPFAVHMPLYQTNTSQHCPLYALYEHGERGIQRFIDGCAMPCMKNAILYPDHLGLVGLYNSIFAVDRRGTEEKPGKIDRIVWNWFPETEVTR